MITNLVFKRNVNIEGSQKTEMKIIKVKIDGIKSSEGWSLVSSADLCTFDDQSGISDHGISIDKFPEVVLCADALPTEIEQKKRRKAGEVQDAAIFMLR